MCRSMASIGFFNHAETITDQNIQRIATLSGGIAVQRRMAFQGEYFVECYGQNAAEATPPIGRMLEMGVPVGAGTDATRVASYNPWVSLSWLVTGRTVGGTTLYPPRNRLDRGTALRLWTQANTWFSNEQGKKGAVKPGQPADLVVLSKDYFAVPETEIADITSALTLLGGKIVWGDGDCGALAPPLPPAMPDWSPVRHHGGYQHAALANQRTAVQASCGCSHSCGVHGHAHAAAWANQLPVADTKSFWGELGCFCCAF